MASARRALLLGINDYPQDPLAFCVKDAEEMAAALTMLEYSFEVQTLLNQDATRRQAKAAIEDLLKQDAEFIIFYFSGHGRTTDSGVYLSTVDADPLDPGIDLDYLRRVILARARPSERVVIILDCCHAGAATLRDSAEIAINIRGEDITRTITGLGNGRVVLAACRADQLSGETSALGHGIFTYHLLDGLLGGAADEDGVVTVSGLYEYVSKALEGVGGQAPVFRGDISGRVVLGSGLRPSTSLVTDAQALGRIEREAEKHVADYQSCIGPLFSDFEGWKASGHKLASSALDPVLRWFKKKIQDHPMLSSRQSFRASYDAVQSRLATLASTIDMGVVTEEGIVKDRLGSGSFGTVWHTTPIKQGGSELAYKVYHPQDLSVEEKVDRFRRGFSAMKQLDHPHIVKVKHLTDCPLGFYMDFIAGPNFRNFVGALPDASDIVALLLTIAETLTHAHGRGVIHRDVKPENIIMYYDTERGQWKPYLTDFDLAWFSTVSQLTRDALGTVYYAAPEQLAKPGSASAHAPTTDIFSFGQLCFYAVARADPVALNLADNVRALRERLGAWKVQRPASEFLKLYEESTRQDPSKRPRDFREICDRLFEVYHVLKESADEPKTVEGFLNEFIFSIVGLAVDSKPASHSFLTLSGETLVEAFVLSQYLEGMDLQFRFLMQAEPMIGGVGNYAQARKILNHRIEVALKDFPDCQRKSGTQSPFEVSVKVPDIPLNWQGVNKCRQIVTRVIDAIENR